MEVERFKVRVRVELMLNNSVILDDTSAKLLMLVDRLGSLLKASKALGMPYSRAWECIARIERYLGGKIVEARRGGRGGGGATLTDLGRSVLNKYINEYRRVIGRELMPPETVEALPLGEAVVYTGSHDPAVQRLAGMLRDSGISIEVYWLGSMKGLASLLLGEGDVAGIHVLDPESGEYNVGIARKLLSGRAVLIKGFERLQVLASREGLGIDEALIKLLKGEAVLANRVYGSGTRLLMDYLLRRKARELGIDEREIPRIVKGYENELRTHDEVARAIAEGEADVGLLIEGIAKAYGLSYDEVLWERFDFVVRIGCGKRAVNSFIEGLRSREFREVINGLPGYRYGNDLGEVINL